MNITEGPMEMCDTKSEGPRPLSIIDRVDVELKRAQAKVDDLKRAKELLQKLPEVAELMKTLRSL